MTTHLAARLVSHDRGWDGHVCVHPSPNLFYVVQQHIRDALANSEKRQIEEENAGVSLAELDGWQAESSTGSIWKCPASRLTKKSGIGSMSGTRQTGTWIN